MDPFAPLTTAEANAKFQRKLLQQENIADGNMPGAIGNPRVFDYVRYYADLGAARTTKALADLEQQPADPAALDEVLSSLNERASQANGTGGTPERGVSDSVGKDRGRSARA